jgi:RNAse (barnase) inhibitor barstar
MTLTEQAHYSTFTQDELIDLMGELEAWRNLGEDMDTLKDKLTAFESAAEKAEALDNLLDCTNHSTALELELRYADLNNFRRISGEFDIQTPAALYAALEALDNYRNGVA